MQFQDKKSKSNSQPTASESSGHKSLNNTMLYTQLINFNDGDFTASVAHTEEEICKLGEAGFSFACDFRADKIFKKCK